MRALCLAAFLRCTALAPPRRLPKAGSALRSAATSAERSSAPTPAEQSGIVAHDERKEEIVLISGFESFNVKLYERCAERVDDVKVTVFSDREQLRGHQRSALFRRRCLDARREVTYPRRRHRLPARRRGRGPRALRRLRRKPTI